MIEIIYNHPNRKGVRRKLRRDSTPQEKMLWDCLRNNLLGVKFKRQYSVGGYIIDFYCPLKRIGIELDGSQHLENKKYDKERTRVFSDLNIKVVRFWNSEVEKNIDGVLKKIRVELGAPK
jgi:very-short-patch-repair endonuclease